MDVDSIDPRLVKHSTVTRCLMNILFLVRRLALLGFATERSIWNMSEVLKGATAAELIYLHQ